LQLHAQLLCFRIDKQILRVRTAECIFWKSRSSVAQVMQVCSPVNSLGIIYMDKLLDTAYASFAVTI
jgi:hypothetical protein